MWAVSAVVLRQKVFRLFISSDHQQSNFPLFGFFFFHKNAAGKLLKK